jgi:membrane protein
MARTLKKLGRLLWSAVNGYQKHNVTRLAASIAFYGILSLAPLAVILVTVGGFFFGQKAVEGLMVDPLKNVVGQDAARAVQSMIASAYRSHGSIPATVLAVIVLVFSGSRLIGDIRNSLNTIWEVMGRAGDGFKGFLVGKLVDLAMIFGLAVLVLATLLTNTAVSAITRYFARSIPFPTLFLQLSSVIFSLLVITGVLTAIFRGLPNVRLGRRDVALGAGLSAVFFEIGNYVIGLYLGRSSLGSVFGAAGSFAVLMIWMYYSSIIVLFGVELTRAYALGRVAAPRLEARELHKAQTPQQSKLPAAGGRPRPLWGSTLWMIAVFVVGYLYGLYRRSRRPVSK